MRRKAQKMGLGMEDQYDVFKDTEPGFHLRKFLDERIKPPRVYSLIRQK